MPAGRLGRMLCRHAAAVPPAKLEGGGLLLLQGLVLLVAPHRMRHWEAVAVALHAPRKLGGQVLHGHTPRVHPDGRHRSAAGPSAVQRGKVFAGVLGR